jgi:hypothetical protein
VRTSSHEFNPRTNDTLVHLTNDAIQSDGPCYSKHEPGNKLSYAELEKYLESEKKEALARRGLPRMREIAGLALEAVAGRLSPARLEHCFELIGMDFILTEEGQPLLLEMNVNPCMETGCPLLRRLIPQLLENTLRVAVDPVLPCCTDYLNSQEHLVPGNLPDTMKYHLLCQFFD